MVILYVLLLYLCIPTTIFADRSMHNYAAPALLSATSVFIKFKKKIIIIRGNKITI